MKIVVFTYDRFDTATTPGILATSGVEHLVVCHSEDMKAKFISHRTVEPSNIVASNAAKGLANNRNWYIDNHLKEGEWCLMLVDDLLKITELDIYDDYLGGNFKLPVNIRNTTKWGKKLRRLVDFNKFLKRCKETIEVAESRGSALAGFAAFNNPLFRINKWKYNALADGRAWLFKKTELRFDVNTQVIDDYAFCAENIVRLSGVLINQWVLPECRRYTAGAFGTIQDRLERKTTECKYLVQKYPGLIAYAPKKGWPAGSHITIKPLKLERLIELNIKRENEK